MSNSTVTPRVIKLTKESAFSMTGPQRVQKAPVTPLVGAGRGHVIYPVWVSPKYDGMRATIQGGQVLSSTLKPIPNKYIQQTLGSWSDLLDGLDGELVVGRPDAPACRQRTMSGVRSIEGKPDFTFYVFDTMADWVKRKPYATRKYVVQSAINELHKDGCNKHVKLVQDITCHTPEELDTATKQCQAAGLEGLMVRPFGAGSYKHGRCTDLEQRIYKVKFFDDAEATVVGFIELLVNTNDSIREADGLLRKSSAAEGMLPANTLGALVVNSKEFGTFQVGSGFTDAEREHIWTHRDEYRGTTVTYKFQRHGMKDKPNPAIFKEFRDGLDHSTSD